MKVLCTAALSLLELLMVIMLITLLGTASLPGIQHFYRLHQLRVVTRSLLHLISSARSIAIASNTAVKLCGGDGCDGQWQSQQQIVQEAKVLRISHVVPAGFALLWRGGFGHKHGLSYNGLGFVNSPGSFYLSSSSLNKRVRIVINQTGRVRVSN